MALDLNAIKTSIQTILDAANTTTAGTDLSNGLQTRVQSVMKINPSRIPVQSSLYPCVTNYISLKNIELKTIAKDQLTGKRRADIEIKIVGIVWNNVVSAASTDEGDDDCESLMENIEQILRGNPTLSGTVLTQLPTAVTFHSVGVDEQAHLRAGIMNLKVLAEY